MEEESKNTPVSISEEPSRSEPDPLPSPRSEIAPRDEWLTVRRLALKQLHRFMSLEAKVLRGDSPDAVHDMRVASRRLQQILDLLYPKPRSQENRKLRRKIRRSRRCLSEVRNCDVLFQHVEKILGRKRTARRAEWSAVRHFLRERRAASFDKALRKLGKINLAVFYVRLKQHLTLGENAQLSVAHGGAPAAEPPAEHFHDRTGAALDRAWRGFDAQLTLSHSNPSPSVVHGARIATKRLRYLVEVIAEFGVSGSAEETAWLRRLQTLLGEWHDLEILEQMMIEMVARPEFLRDHLELAVGIEKLIVQNRKAKDKFKQDYFRMTLESPDVQRLKAWVDYLLASPSAAFTNA
jgi:CHAD domain-containing protein